jgi:DNA primase
VKYDFNLDRVVFPVYNHQSKLVGAVGRAIGDDPKKYHNYFGFKSTKAMGGEDQYETARKKALLVEGFMDLLTLSPLCSEFDFDVYCSWTSKLSSRHASHLISRYQKLLVWYDKDEAGDEGYKKVLSLCGNYIQIKRIITPSDPNSMGTEACRPVLKTQSVFSLFSHLGDV